MQYISVLHHLSDHKTQMQQKWRLRYRDVFNLCHECHGLSPWSVLTFSRKFLASSVCFIFVLIEQHRDLLLLWFFR